MEYQLKMVEGVMCVYNQMMTRWRFVQREWDGNEWYGMAEDGERLVVMGTNGTRWLRMGRHKALPLHLSIVCICD